MSEAPLAARWRSRPDLAAGAFLFVVYLASLARGMTFWDAGEFLAAIHSLGIPHPPGTPLYVLAARVWADAFTPIAGFTIAVNAFSAACTAVAFGAVAHMFWRWLRDPVLAFAAATCAGLMSTVWLNATETEVYAASLCLAFLIVLVGDRAGATRDPRWLLLLAYLTGLAWALHLTALLGVPCALLLAWPALRAARLRHWAAAPFLVALGASVVLYMLVRAPHDPFINQGDPATWHALWDAVQRHQYDVAPLWPRRAPLWLQFGNVFEYADWQFALGLAQAPPPTVARTGVTIVYALLGIYGAMRHRAIDRRSFRVWMAFFLITSVGVVLYLNMHAGASYGVGVLPANAVHEARDRDYFFTWAFVCWGTWAGIGAVAIARRVLASRLHAALAGVGVALLPLVLNWSAIRFERGDEQRRAEREGRALLANVPRNAVFLAVGDNDTYSLWYLQEVQGMRRDVTVVTVPLLPPEWARAELLRRHALLDSGDVKTWYGYAVTTARVRAHAAAQGRPVVVSPYASAIPIPK